MNKRSIATVSLSGTLDEKPRTIAAAGFQAVEILRVICCPFPAVLPPWEACAAISGST
jgi:hypothetical protein